MSDDSHASAFRAVPRTGVIYVTTEAARLGFRSGDPEWCNLGQGQPETGPLPGAPARIEDVTISVGDQESVLELTFNHDGRTYDLGTGYGHIAVGVDDLAQTLEELAAQGIEPEREPYRVREGGALICFVRDPDGYRIELIDRSGK